MTTEILQHTIRFEYFGGDIKSLPESEESHIETMIQQGCSSGELNYYDNQREMDFRGWWSIER